MPEALETFEARDGDVLVVGYPEVTLPLKIKYATVKIGGWIYTRKLREGDDVAEEARRVHAFLRQHALKYGKIKVEEISRELGG